MSGGMAVALTQRAGLVTSSLLRFSTFFDSVLVVHIGP